MTSLSRRGLLGGLGAALVALKAGVRIPMPKPPEPKARGPERLEDHRELFSYYRPNSIMQWKNPQTLHLHGEKWRLGPPC